MYSYNDGVKLLIIKDLATKQFSLHHLFEGECYLNPDVLDLQLTDSNLIIASAFYFDRDDYNEQYGIKLVQVDLPQK